MRHKLAAIAQDVIDGFVILGGTVGFALVLDWMLNHHHW